MKNKKTGLKKLVALILGLMLVLLACVALSEEIDAAEEAARIAAEQAAAEEAARIAAEQAAAEEAARRAAEEPRRAA